MKVSQSFLLRECYDEKIWLYVFLSGLIGIQYLNHREVEAHFQPLLVAA